MNYVRTTAPKPPDKRMRCKRCLTSKLRTAHVGTVPLFRCSTCGGIVTSSTVAKVLMTPYLKMLDYEEKARIALSEEEVQHERI